MEPSDIEHQFTYHVPTDKKRADHEKARKACQQAAERLNRLCPEGREKSLAITKLEEAMFWANAAIARNQ